MKHSVEYRFTKRLKTGIGNNPDVAFTALLIAWVIYKIIEQWH